MQAKEHPFGPFDPCICAATTAKLYFDINASNDYEKELNSQIQNVMMLKLMSMRLPSGPCDPLFLDLPSAFSCLDRLLSLCYALHPQMRPNVFSYPVLWHPLFFCDPL